MGDVAKVNCQTCHQGVYKPYFGAPAAKDYPELRKKSAPAADESEGVGESAESTMPQGATAERGERPASSGAMPAVNAALTARR
jgi:mono/diheme cytochrome c family protein